MTSFICRSEMRKFYIFGQSTAGRNFNLVGAGAGGRHGMGRGCHDMGKSYQGNHLSGFAGFDLGLKTDLLGCCCWYDSRGSRMDKQMRWLGKTSS